MKHSLMKKRGRRNVGGVLVVFFARRRSKLLHFFFGLLPRHESLIPAFTRRPMQIKKEEPLMMEESQSTPKFVCLLTRILHSLIPPFPDHCLLSLS